MDNSVIIPPLRYRQVDVAGRVVSGRPIKYATKPVTKDLRDSTGEYIVPTLFETMCPHCCLRMTFSGDLVSARCPHCKRGSDVGKIDEFPDPFCEPGQFDYNLLPLSIEKIK